MDMHSIMRIIISEMHMQNNIFGTSRGFVLWDVLLESIE